MTRSGRISRFPAAETGKDRLGRMRKKRLAGLALMALLVIAGSVRALADTIPTDMAQGETPATVTGLEVEIIWDESGLVRVGRELPITVRVSSSGPQVDGSAIVYAPANRGDYYKMEERLSVSAGETKETVFSIPVDYSTSMILVEYRDADGTLYAARELTIRPGYGTQEIYIGAVASEDVDLDGFDRVTLNEYNGITTRLFELTEETFPDRIEKFRLYDIFLLDEFDRSDFSAAQMQALDDWVYEGGIIIIGNGSDMAAQAQEGETVRENWGSGLYVYCGFPLWDAAGNFSEESSVREFFYDTIGADSLSALENSMQNGTDDYWNARNMTARVDPARLPKVGQYAVVLIVYLVVLGPVLYWILKKKGRQGALRSAMIAISLLFAGVIYLMGTRTRFTRPFMNYASIQEIRGDMVRETIYANICSPYNSSYSFRIGADYDVLPVLSYDNQTETFDTEKNDCQLAVYYGEEGTQVEINDDIPFTAEYFRLSRRSEDTYGAGFTGELGLFRGEASGYLINETGVSLERVCILAGGFLIVAGDMEPGQQVDLSQAPIYSVPPYRQYEMLQTISGMYAFDTASESEEAAVAAWRNEVTSYYINSMMITQTNDAVILAFPSRENVNILEEADVEVRGVTLITAQMEVDYSRDGQVYVPVLLQEPEVLQGNYDASDNSTYLQLVVLQYDFGEVPVDSILFEWPEEQAADSYMQAFRGTMEFYNWETGSYDKIEPREEYDSAYLEPYLDGENRLTVRYEDETAEEYSYQIILPQLSVIGREEP